MADKDFYLGYTIQLDVPTRLFEDNTCWFIPWAGVVNPTAEDGSTVIMTLTRTHPRMHHPDTFSGIYTMRTDDNGKTWEGPKQEKNLAPRAIGENGEILDRFVDPWEAAWDGVASIANMCLKWHDATETLLATGGVARYTNGSKSKDSRGGISYTAYKPDKGEWSKWQVMDLPLDRDTYYMVGAGSSQRVDLSDGTILLPFVSKSKGAGGLTSAVMRCRFDGETLTYIEHGNEMTLPYGRGFAEPQLTHFGDTFYLTLRNDIQGYVTTSKDGLTFGQPQPWTVDENSPWPASYPPLLTYGAQQHWVTHSDALFLVYTRRGACNDHVYRHRAPLFMAQVDPEKLCVIKETERRIVPERGARLGNQGVANIREDETWITVAENMHKEGCEEYGSDGSVYVARIKWNKKNQKSV